MDQRQHKRNQAVIKLVEDSKRKIEHKVETSEQLLLKKIEELQLMVYTLAKNQGNAHGIEDPHPHRDCR
jgi:hypothetical protein